MQKDQSLIDDESKKGLIAATKALSLVNQQKKATPIRTITRTPMRIDDFRDQMAKT